MTSFFGKIGKGFEHVGKALETAGKDTGKAVEKAAPVAAVVLPELPLPGAALASKVLGLVTSKIEGEEMNPLEQFAITIVLGTLQTVVKNPAHAALLKNQLLGVAADIYGAYGITPPSVPAVPAASAS